MAVILLVIGLVVGAAATYLWMRERLGRNEEKLALLEESAESQIQWEERVKAVTGEALVRSQTSLLELADAKLAPIKETLTKFEQQAQALEARRLSEVSRIGEQLRAVAEAQEKLRS